MAGKKEVHYMGRRGPVAKMAHRTTGTWMAASQCAFQPPDYLSALAREYWEGIVAAFPAGYFVGYDSILLEQYCEAAAQHKSATAMLQKEGRRFKDKKGVWRRHPAVDCQSQARRECAMLATKLRITKQAMVRPETAGRAAHDAARSTAVDGEFGNLLWRPDTKQ